MTGTRAGRVAAGAALLVAVLTAAGMAALWPGDGAEVAAPPAGGPVAEAEVLGVGGGCEAYAGPRCVLAAIALRSGPDAGARSFITLPNDDLAPSLEAGDRIRVAPNVPAEGSSTGLALDDPAASPFAFVDFERSTSLLWLAVGFAALVVVLGGRQGARALVGLALALLVVIGFVVPAILDGGPPLAVALVGGAAVMLVTMAATHGLGVKTAAAVLGTSTALALTALLALAAVEVAHITGFSSEQTTLLLAAAPGSISPTGLVLAGIVIGALGVLDDVTISQSSTVLALRRANPALGFRRLFTEGLVVGRDHLGATVNTLVLAYAGAALPVLLIFATQGASFGDAINREPVAEEIVAMLVGSVGLLAAVPLTTAIAATLASRLPADAVPGDAHAH